MQRHRLHRCATATLAVYTTLYSAGYLSLCIQLTLQAAQRYGFPSEPLIFETAESEQVRDQTHLTRILQGYRERGFLIAVDDVGAGYAGLKLLADFRPDLIAAWRARVGIPDGTQHVAFCAAIERAAFTSRLG